MAAPTPTLIQALLEAIDTLEAGAPYQWGHMGSCNCGHLARALTKRSQAEIHAAALRRAGDWGQQAIDYCPQSGLPLDFIITQMLDAGLTLNDIHALERLNDPEVLAHSPKRWMSQNSREDLLLYLKTWVSLLQQRRHAQIHAVVTLPTVAQPQEIKKAG